MLMLLLILYSCLSVSLKAQTCQDSGQTNSCQCPFGLTNSPNCDTLACGNPYILPSKRPAFNATAAPDSGRNGCQNQCTDGFGGLTCNMCRTSQACQAAISPSPSGADSSSSLAFSASQDVICNTQAPGYGVNFAQCEVDNPTLASFYPGQFWGTIQRNVDPSITPMPSSIISSLSTGTALAEIWYSPNASSIPQQQFFCEGMKCAQQILNGLGIYRCETIKCRCLPGSTFCGGGAGISLAGAINALSGDMSLECPTSNFTAPLDMIDPSRSCKLKTVTLEKLLGPNGLALVNCGSGECVQRSTAEARHQSLYQQGTAKNRPPISAVLGLIAIVSALLALVALVLFGIWQQHKARHPLRPSFSRNANGAARVVWKDLRYMLPSTGPRSGYRRARPASTPTAGRNSSCLSSIRNSHVAVLEHQPAVYDIHHSKEILRGLNGTVEPGRMMAILGPSGSGKSTFLDILAGQRKAGKVSGSHSISIPDRKTTAVSGGRITIGFVDQADIVSATSTVREALTFAAKLKLPEDVSAQARESRVAEVIELLGLSHVAQSRIGNDEVRGLSGGERRRVSIGLELISKPSILFLDEPTSGLDSVSAMRVVNVLKGLSSNAPEGCGTTIVCSIHQPSSQIYHAFDSIFLLGPGGRQVYSGNTEDAAAFIASHGLHCPPGYNIADYLLEVASDPPKSIFEPVTPSDKCSEGYPASIQSNPPCYLAKTQPLTTMMTQFQSLAQREWINLKRDPTLFWMHAAVAVVTGVFLGAMYFQVKLTIAGFQNRIGSMFFLGAIVSFSALSALNNFLHVRLLFMRERASKYYSPVTWLLSRLCFDVIPLRVIPSLTISTIMYFMVGLQPRAENFLKFLLVILQLTIVQTLFNFFLAATFSDGGQAILFASLTNLLQFAFAGFFVNLSTLSPVLKWIQYLAPFKYALEAMTLNEAGSGLMIVDNLQGINIQTSATLIMDTLFGFKPDAFWRDVLCLFAFIAGLAALLTSSVFYKLQQTR